MTMACGWIWIVVGPSIGCPEMERVPFPGIHWKGKATVSPIGTHTNISRREIGKGANTETPPSMTGQTAQLPSTSLVRARALARSHIILLQISISKNVARQRGKPERDAERDFDLDSRNEESAPCAHREPL